MAKSPVCAVLYFRIIALNQALGKEMGISNR